MLCYTPSPNLCSNAFLKAVRTLRTEHVIFYHHTHSSLKSICYLAAKAERRVQMVEPWNVPELPSAARRYKTQSSNLSTFPFLWPIVNTYSNLPLFFLSIHDQPVTETAGAFGYAQNPSDSLYQSIVWFCQLITFLCKVSFTAKCCCKHHWAAHLGPAITGGKQWERLANTHRVQSCGEKDNSKP